MIHIDVAYFFFALALVCLALAMIWLFGSGAVRNAENNTIGMTIFLLAIIFAFLFGTYRAQVYHPCEVLDWNKMTTRCK